MLLPLASANAFVVNVDMSEYNSPSFTTPEGVRFIADQAAGQTNPKYNAGDKGVRMYQNNTLTILCDSAMTSVVFSLTGDPTPIEASVGECLTDGQAMTVTWTGSADSIVLTVGTKTIDGLSGGRLSYNKVAITIDADTLIAPQPEPQPEPEPIVPADTITVTEAVEIASALTKNDTTVEYYAIQGYVTVISEVYKEANNYVTFSIADEPDGRPIIEFFRARPERTEDADVAVGDLIFGIGRMENYKGSKPEFSRYSTFRIVEKADTAVVEPIEYPDTLSVAQVVELAQTLGKNDTTPNHIVEGYVTNIRTVWSSSNKNITLWLSDEQGGKQDVQLFRATPEDLADSIVKVGDKVMAFGRIINYNGTPEFYYPSYRIIETAPVDTTPVVIDAISIAEFLEKADPTTTYQLIGIVNNITNTLYGNFDLVEIDGDASIYIYGLLNAQGQAKQFESMNIEQGDTLTLQGVYVEFKGKKEIENALYISHRKRLTDRLELTQVDNLVSVVDGELIVTAQGDVCVFNVAGQMLYSGHSQGNLHIRNIKHGQIIYVNVGKQIAKLLF